MNEHRNAPAYVAAIACVIAICVGLSLWSPSSPEPPKPRMEITAVGDKCDLGDFGTFEVRAQEPWLYVVYAPPRWIMKIPEHVRWKRMRLEWRTDGTEWKSQYAENMGTDPKISVPDFPWHRYPDGMLRAWVASLSGEWEEKSFYLRACVLDETQKWDTSPDVQVTLHKIRRRPMSAAGTTGQTSP